MAAVICLREQLRVGTNTVLECPAPNTHFGVVFEDDAETGYFYGLDLSREHPGQVVDALHIYNVHSVTDKEKPSLCEIVWAEDGLKAGLFLNGQPHAVFDFASRRGYCRNNFPAISDWSKTHEWDDRALELFR